MAKIIGLPKLSPTMEEGTLVRWVKQEGESIEVDDLIAEVDPLLDYCVGAFVSQDYLALSARDHADHAVRLVPTSLFHGGEGEGSVVQELVVARLYEGSEGDVGPVFAVLWGASLLSILALAVALWRAHKGKADI